ncbi:MAG: hypothetical protein KIT84_08845 [Labilithrix sp.]|nr:hypothetical protein [Labilithrix sp.]MCW5811106.1 hypothetical protein [Labilithrix sp.]
MIKVSRLLLASSVVSFALLQGCASDDDEPSKREKNPFGTREEPVFVEKAVNADHKFSNAVDATDPKKLVVPTAGQDAVLSKIEVGTILAGDRDKTATDLTQSKNPYGFLRKVTGVKTEGGNTVIETEPATLDEWLQNGDIYYDDPTSLFDDDVATGGKIKTRTLKTLAESGGGSGSASSAINQEFEGPEILTDRGIKVKPIVKFANGTLQVNTKYDGYFRVRTFIGIPTKVSTKSLLTVDPLVGVDLTIGVAAHDVGTIGIAMGEKKFDLPGVVIPIAAPIPLTVRVFPRLKCSLQGGGETSATVRAELRGHAAVGFEAEASINGIDTKNLSESPTISPTFQFKGGVVKGVIGAKCSIVAVPSVLAFDAVGINGEVGPAISVDLTACAVGNVQSQSISGGITATEQHGIQLQFNTRLQIPVVSSIGIDIPLATFSPLQSEKKYFLGNKDTCELKQEDSCAGRSDGFYCSTKEPWTGFYCEDKVIASGQQCANETERCVGGTKTEIRCN